MKSNKTLLLAILTVLVVSGVYFFDYKAEINNEQTQSAPILDQNRDQISYIQIIKPNLKIGLQKNEKGWSLLEPVKDIADNDNVESLINALFAEKQMGLVKQSNSDLTNDELTKFGLNKPVIIFNFKNNRGLTQKIAVGETTNYEGKSYIRKDDENKILISGSIWHEKSEQDLIYYREKKMFRHSLAFIDHIKVKSLQDSFELKKKNNIWVDISHNYSLDQNKVRELLKKISDTNIEEYVFEGEPSDKILNEKGLSGSPVSLTLTSDSANWTISMNINTKDKALYALTERPTYLVKIEIGAWETFGNLNLKSLRDRSSALVFNPEEVQKIYYKNYQYEMNLSSDNGQWKNNDNKADKISAKLNSDNIKKILSKVHELTISEFIDQPQEQVKFEGKNMLILKSASEKLLLQLNWGPSFEIKKTDSKKEYYYARTQLSEQTFALEKSIIDSLGLEQLNEASDTKQNNESPEKRIK